MEGIDEDRFWAKVRKFDTCWVWTGARDHNGYGRLRSKRPNPRTFYAHRVAYELLVGPIPDGLEIDHRCFNPPCVRPGPEHCEPASHTENVRRARGNGWQRNAVKTHCKQGHPYTSDNTNTFRGHRQCRTCAIVYKARHAAKLAAQKAAD
jgi:hypothetical protein